MLPFAVDANLRTSAAAGEQRQRWLHGLHGLIDVPDNQNWPRRIHIDTRDDARVALYFPACSEVHAEYAANPKKPSTFTASRSHRTPWKVLYSSPCEYWITSCGPLRVTAASRQVSDHVFVYRFFAVHITPTCATCDTVNTTGTTGTT